MSNIKALFLASNPKNTNLLALDEEIREINAKIRASDNRDSIDLISAWAVRPDDLLQMFNQHRPQIVHFSGHGSESGEIILTSDNGEIKPVSNSALKSLFTTLKDNIKVVVLNCCYSKEQAKAITQVIDCAVGMSDAIGDKAAITFAASFYRAIGFGRSVKEAFDQGITALLLEGIPEENTPELLVRDGVNPSQVFLLKPLTPDPHGSRGNRSKDPEEDPGYNGKEDRVLIKNTKHRFKNLCNEYRKKNKNILVVGEVMLDHKIRGSEAKYQDVQKHDIVKREVEYQDVWKDEIVKRAGEVYMVNEEPKTLGGAADIAMALSKISNVTLIGVVGLDCEGKTLIEECKAHDIKCGLIEAPNVKTTTKIYIERLTQGTDKETIRFDRESTESMKRYCESNHHTIINEVSKYVNNIDCIVIKDHNKGMISKELIEKIASIIGDKIPLYVDPKYNWERFESVEIKAILPNIKEAASGLYDIEKNEYKVLKRDKSCTLEYIECSNLFEMFSNCENIIIKAAKEGAIIMSRIENNCPIKVRPFLTGHDFKTDVGCGDVFDAFVIVGMLCQHTPKESVLFANFIAGLKTKKSLGEHMCVDDIEKELEKDSFKKYVTDNSKLFIELEDSEP